MSKLYLYMVVVRLNRVSGFEARPVIYTTRVLASGNAQASARGYNKLLHLWMEIGEYLVDRAVKL